MLTPWLRDPDVTLYHGDVLATLRELPAESVDCVVTSPPYWGLRDYGTGAWEGGDAGCDHKQGRDGSGRADGIVDERAQRNRDGAAALTRQVCKCGATRIDQQLGLEPTPEQYVELMVEVFREVRRVLAAHGTVWLNLGDSYASQPAGNKTPSGFSQTRPSRRKHGVGDETVDIPARAFGDGLKQKDLVGVPWRVAFALQADGWYLRSDIIWAKPNPMPESVTDRPTKAHEYLFLLSKQSRYFFDQEAVRERYQDPREGGDGFRWHSERYTQQKGPQNNSAPTPRGPDGRRKTTVQGADGSIQHRDGERWPNGGRNIRSVWEIATQPYPEAHFATFPEELARRCIAAGTPEAVCRVCGKARERVVSSESYLTRPTLGSGSRSEYARSGKPLRGPSDAEPKRLGNQAWITRTAGFTDCGHSDYRPGIVLDPFAGSGTTMFVARKLGRHSIGIDLNADYLALAARRLQQQSLFAEAGA